MSSLPLSCPAPSDLTWLPASSAAGYYRCELPASCRPVAAWLARDRNCPATIRYLSTRDLGLVVSRRFEAGAGLGVQLPAALTQGEETLLVKVLRVESRTGGQWLHRCALISELTEDSVLALVGPEASSSASEQRDGGSAAGWRSRLRASLPWTFLRDRCPARVPAGVWVAALLCLGGTAGGLLRLLRWAAGW
ncbi:MAG TPA: hypothetical protein VEL76_15615 [Gemmataceae bacterium]|nr:hypothetical protein [Gemmataceae bacterium]